MLREPVDLLTARLPAQHTPQRGRVSRLNRRPRGRRLRGGGLRGLGGELDGGEGVLRGRGRGGG
ncbi:hypothetical protein, partial [Streptomyces virginiae]|uniref:hypothetical protein n=1 Tax=Streptomyces virginiae TaxID=1961 RepID=UPI00345D2CBB